MSDPNYEKPRTEAFDIVLIRRSVTEQTATPEDFKRVPVTAPDTLAALQDPALEPLAAEWRTLWAVPAGHQTDPERQAQARAYNGKPTDPSKIGF